MLSFFDERLNKTSPRDLGFSYDSASSAGQGVPFFNINGYSAVGGSIVGRGAAELISVLALAVTCNLKVGDLVDSVLVHPALSESLADAAE